MKNRMNRYNIMNCVLLYSQNYDIRLLCRIMYNDPCLLCYIYIFCFYFWFTLSRDMTIRVQLSDYFKYG